MLNICTYIYIYVRIYAHEHIHEYMYMCICIGLYIVYLKCIQPEMVQILKYSHRLSEHEKIWKFNVLKSKIFEILKITLIYLLSKGWRGICHYPGTRGGQRTAWESVLPPPPLIPVWDPGIKLKSSGLVTTPWPAEPYHQSPKSELLGCHVSTQKLTNKRAFGF